jgi:hypothetical protein
VSDPHAEYSKRLEACLKTIASRERVHRRVGNAKLAIIVAGLVLTWLSLGKHPFPPTWLAVPVALYAVLAVLHERVIRTRTRAETAASFYRKGLARMEDRWAGTGAPGERFRDAKHVYAEDLDLFGRGCLFELLSTARMPMGEERLAQWLLSPSPIGTLVERQALVTELREKLDLREHLAVTGEDLRARLNPETLPDWAEGKPILPAPAWRGVAAFLAVGATASLVYAVMTWSYAPLLIVLVLETILLSWLHRRAAAVVAGMTSNAEGLVLFSEILKRFEAEPFTSPRLRGFVEKLKGGALPASRAIRRLAYAVYWADASEGLLAKILNLPLLYTVQVAFALEAWRRQWGAQMRGWIDIAGEMEALLSLASYSFEHPGDPFPEFAQGSDREALFDGEALGHPLIPAAQCVRNSVRLDKQTRVLLVSGSNMSGKSTLLRTVGINTILAMAGAPIRGKSLRLTPLAVGTRIRSTDSLQEGRSSFYTEILHIRQVFDLRNAETPLLFLFDELLEGTNSKDRRIGAEGLIRALLNGGAIGIVSTHDLALTDITEFLGNVVRNMHFEDRVEGGKMQFDYRLRDGVVAKSNALELMRLIGLDV